MSRGSDHPAGRSSERVPTTDANGFSRFFRGRRVVVRAWSRVRAGAVTRPERTATESIGVVIEGVADLILEDRVVRLEPGDVWYVPDGTLFRLRVLETWSAIESAPRGADLEDRARSSTPGRDREAADPPHTSENDRRETQ